jgi:hypothetical protein
MSVKLKEYKGYEINVSQRGTFRIDNGEDFDSLSKLEEYLDKLAKVKYKHQFAYHINAHNDNRYSEVTITSIDPHTSRYNQGEAQYWVKNSKGQREKLSERSLAPINENTTNIISALIELDAKAAEITRERRELLDKLRLEKIVMETL